MRPTERPRQDAGQLVVARPAARCGRNNGLNTPLGEGVVIWSEI